MLSRNVVIKLIKATLGFHDKEDERVAFCHPPQAINEISPLKI
jgi:hypothetical protein